MLRATTQTLAPENQAERPNWPAGLGDAGAAEPRVSLRFEYDEEMRPADGQWFIEEITQDLAVAADTTDFRPLPAHQLLTDGAQTPGPPNTPLR